ncbi:MAG: porin [Candidatus Sulfotelmatobacter sp.]
MRSLTALLVLVLGFMAPGSLVHAQGTEPASQSDGSSSVSATKEEVNQLRGEVAAQRQTIEELKALVQQLVSQAPVSTVRADLHGSEGVHLMNAALVEPVQTAKAADKDQKPAEKKTDSPVIAGWNGEHFFIKSGDGKFQLQPYGYFMADYRGYHGDGAPSNTFLISRARLGFQGNYGSHYDFALLIDAAATNGILLRDLYVNIKPNPAFQFQAGQFKEPFAQELLSPDTSLDFVERSLASLLYPNASSSYRSPGVAIHGDLDGGVFQYTVGAFNGKGMLTNNTTNEPEIIGRLRFYPWKKKKDSLFQGLAFGGSVGHGRSRGLSSEQSFSATLPDAAYTFFPQFRINGSIERYNADFTLTHGPWAIRAEYDQLNQFRDAVGSETSDGLGFVTLPGVVAKAGYAQATYLLTGETRPENGSPKVKHPVLGPETTGITRGMGAWELAFRYDRIQAKEPGISLLSNPLTPGFVPTFDDHTDEFTFGVNWYLNNWLKYQANFLVDRLKDPSVTGQVPQNFFVMENRLQFRF